MQDLYPKLLAADSWVIATPVYWFTMSAQMKSSWIVASLCPSADRPFPEKRIAMGGCGITIRSFQAA